MAYDELCIGCSQWDKRYVRDRRMKFRAGIDWRRWKAVAVAIGAAVTASAVIGVPHAVAGPATTNVTRVISSISIKGFPLPATPTITVNGKSFGKAPTKGTSPSVFANCGGSGTGLDYGPSKLWLLDASRSSGAGLLGAFQEGANADQDLRRLWRNHHQQLEQHSGRVYSRFRLHRRGRPPWRPATRCASRSRGLPGCTKLP